MNKVLLLVLIIGLVVADAWFLLNKPVVEEATVNEQKIGSIVRLVNPSGRTVCTGTVVNANTIITAAHCIMVPAPVPFEGAIMNPNPIEIRGSDNKAIGVVAKAIYHTPQLDQAILHGDFRKFEPRPYITNVGALVDTHKKDATELIACGYPLFGDLYCTKMLYVDVMDFMWSTKGTLLPGMSGGPVMLLDGTLVAVNVAVSGNISIVSPIYNLDINF